ncbi:MAG: hypothetical protein JJU19_05240 [Pararhodobacter sp.]|nr:hypothetical protein [Pararhodobacter sp.]
MILKTVITAALASLMLAMPASAQCFADYRAKRENPLRLHYGVVQIPQSACGNASAAAAHLRPRLQQDGWIFLDILSTFGPEGLEARRARAGAYFLRY